MRSKMIRRQVLRLLTIPFLVNTTAVAETTAVVPGLQTVIAAAYERYPQTALAGATQQQGRAVRQQASSLLADNPSVVLRHENDELTDNNGFRNWEGSVQMPLWLPGQRKSRLEVATSTEQQAADLIPYYKWQISGKVRELVWSVRIAETEQTLATEAVESAKALERDIIKRVEAGELALTDRIMAGKERLTREIELAGVNNDLGALQSEYKLLTGLSSVPEQILEEDTRREKLDKAHPALALANSSTDRARSERDRARHEKRGNPVLALGSKNERAESGQAYDTILTIELNLPLGLKGQSAPAIALAEKQLTEQQVSYASLKRELETQLAASISERQRAARALELVKRQQKLAAQGLRLARRAFELGESDLFTLLQARTQYLAAERDLQLRTLEQGRAIARHNQALGVILK